ncbi:MAG TPA: MobF family relaxase [Solirubrobacterales bacterium]
MLTIRKIQIELGDAAGALAAARYPLEASDSPQAYRREGEEGPERGNTMWLGSEEALGKFGLERGAAVKVEELAAAMRGRHALRPEEQVRAPGYVDDLKDGKPQLLADGRNLKKPVINTYDLTFSVPKSVSVLWSAAGPALRAEIEQAIVGAANAALEHLVRTRPVISGKARGFAASAAVHVTARMAKGELVPSPQLHVHLYLLGILDEKGDIRAPNNSAFYKQSAMREAGAVGRAALAETMRELGFGVEASTGRGERYFEIAGVPAGLRELMSGRSREVREWIARRVAELGGELSGRERARAALATRAAKRKDLSPAAVEKVWEGLREDFRFGRRELEALRAAPAPELDLAAVEEQVRATILRQIRQEGPTVSAGAARSLAFEAAPAGISLQRAGELLEELQGEGQLIALAGGRVTTREIRERELYVRKVATQAAGRRRSRLPARAVEQGIAKAERSGGFELDVEQKEAVRKLSGGAGWGVLTGRAGTGKGPVLEALAEAHRRQGWRVIPSAVDGATSGRLAVQVGGEALTIEQLMYRVGNGGLAVDRRTLILVEEASKVGLGDWWKLARLCEGSGARLVAIGDTRQLGAIECPGMLDVMIDPGKAFDVGEEQGPIPVAQLQTVRRHKDPRTGGPHPWLGEHLDHLYAGNGAKAIEVLRRERAIEMTDSREEAMEAMVERWRERRAEQRIEAKDAVLVVPGPNTDVDTVNAIAQQRRYRDGELGSEGIEAVDRGYRLYEGDVVMLREAAYRLPPSPGARAARIENGTLGTVSAVDAEGDRVEVAFELPDKTQRAVWIDFEQLRAVAADAGREGPVPSLRLAYAGHPFPLQGGTWRYVGSLLGHSSEHNEEAYVANSRAAEFLDVFTDRESCGLQGEDEDRYRGLAERLSRDLHRDASITFAEQREARIFSGLEVPEPAPELPAPEGALPPSLLRAYEWLLGEERAARIEAQARGAAGEIGALGSPALRGELERGRRAASLLEPAAALEVGRIERDLPLLAERIERSAAAVADAHGRRTGLFSRERAVLLQRAAAASRIAEEDERTRAGLGEREEKLREDGLHPEDWVAEQGERYARGLAAERELRARGEIDSPPGLEQAADLAAPGLRERFELTP